MYLILELAVCALKLSLPSPLILTPMTLVAASQIFSQYRAFHISSVVSNHSLFIIFVGVSITFAIAN
jgi:hypothetical protein